MSKNSKKMGSRRKSLAMRVSALLATTTLVLAPLNTSAAGLGDLLGGVTGTVGGVLETTTGVVGGVVGTVEGTLADPVGTVTGVVGNTVGVVNGVVSDPVGTVGSLVENPVGTVVSVVDGVVPGLLPEEGIILDTPLVDAEVSKEGLKARVLSDDHDKTAGTSGTLNARVGFDSELTASVNTIQPDTDKLVLTYSGKGLVSVDLLEKFKVAFKMPEEYAALLKDEDFVKGLSASFDSSLLNIAGITLLDNSGTYTSDEITIDAENRLISVDFSNLLQVDLLSSLDLLGSGKQSFSVSLEIPLDEVPCALDNEFTFQGFHSDAHIDVAVLETEKETVNVGVVYGEDNPCIEDEDDDDDKDKDPGKDDDDDDDKTTPPADDQDDDGKKLPITATNMGNIGLIGLLTVLAGFAVRFLTRKTAN